jgi:hypothetical protein
MLLWIDTADATAFVEMDRASQYTTTTMATVLVLDCGTRGTSVYGFERLRERVMEFKADEFVREIRAMRRRNAEASIATIRELARRAGEWAAWKAPHVYFPARRACGAVPARQSFYQGAF